MQLLQWDFCFCDTCQVLASQSTFASSFLARNTHLSAPLYALGCPWLAVGFRPLDDVEVPLRNMASMPKTPHSSGYGGLFLLSRLVCLSLDSKSSSEKWRLHIHLLYIQLYSIPKILFLDICLWGFEPYTNLNSAPASLHHHNQCSLSLLLTWFLPCYPNRAVLLFLLE